MHWNEGFPRTNRWLGRYRYCSEHVHHRWIYFSLWYMIITFVYLFSRTIPEFKMERRKKKSEKARKHMYVLIMITELKELLGGTSGHLIKWRRSWFQDSSIHHNVQPLQHYSSLAFSEIVPISENFHVRAFCVFFIILQFSTLCILPPNYRKNNIPFTFSVKPVSTNRHDLFHILSHVRTSSSTTPGFHVAPGRQGCTIRTYCESWLCNQGQV